MDIRVLEYYLMVAREESITKAANLLHVTQPTLSRQMIQLEQEFEVKLFQRTSHSIVLTNDGLQLKRRAQEIVELADKTKNELKKGLAEISGQISVGCGEFQSVGLFTKIIAEFRKQNPLVTFQIYSGNSSNIKERIESGILDVGLIFDYVDIRKYEYIRMPQEEEWGVYVKDDSSLALKDKIRPEDICELPLIISERSLKDNDLSDWIGKGYDDLNIVATYNLLHNAAIMVANDIGVAGGIKINSNFNGVKFVSASPTVVNKTIFVWKKTTSHSPTVEAFIEFVKTSIK